MLARVGVPRPCAPPCVCTRVHSHLFCPRPVMPVRAATNSAAPRRHVLLVRGAVGYMAQMPDVCVCGSYTNRSARRAKATTASSDCRPRPTVPDRVRHCIVKFGWAERESAFVDGLRERVLFVLEISWGTATHALLTKKQPSSIRPFWAMG